MNFLKFLNYVPIVAQACSFSEVARNVTEISNPVQALLSAKHILEEFT